MKLYKFRGLQGFDRTLDIILNERIYCAEYKDLNDPFEGMLNMIVERGSEYPMPYGARYGMSVHKEMSITEAVPDVAAIRVGSLCRSIKDVRMWALYAESFSGIAIELDIEETNPRLHRVEYNDNLPHLDPFIGQKVISGDILTKKTTHWLYEDEYRIISDVEYFGFSGMVTAVYLGTRISDFHRNIIEKSVPNIPIINTQLDRKTVAVLPAIEN